MSPVVEIDRVRGRNTAFVNFCDLEDEDEDEERRRLLLAVL